LVAYGHFALGVAVDVITYSTLSSL